ncbi:hypothetical protein BAE44_0013073 [Dichanthelium oligosanthes]|uniref:C2H2-type domain-containing protein n=1 Tax=Dichanthelium oligosanthes TaxID=888268 RepID=A0A1E5VLA1_9POAL|nr:hypothetical protein BAE44_0013073 [Dichanthelium oligosanthes]
MLTNAGALKEVMQMDGYLLCEVCNVRTADRVTMMCHLEGSKHISKAQKKGQASSNKPPDEASKNGVKGMSMPEAGTSAVASADPERVVELYGVPPTVRQLQGFLLCELCNVQVPPINGMRLHLSGKKHKNKANTSSDASVNVSTGEAAKEQPMDTDTAVVAGMADQVEAPLAKSLEANVGDDSEIQETTVTSMKEDVATMDNTKTLGKKVTTASASAAAAQDNNVCDPYSLTMEVDSVHHPLQRVNSFLVCPCCSVKAPSEIVMRSHLAGKKHKHKMTLAARVSKDTSVLATGADEVKGNSSKSMKANLEAESAPSPVAHVKNAAAMAPMEVDRPAEVKPDTCIEHAQDGEITRVQSRSSKSMHADEEAKSVPSFTGPQAKNAAFMAPMEVDGLEEVQPVTLIEPAEDGELTKQIDQGEHAPAVANGSVTTQVKESVKMDEAPGKPTKIQVEGKVFTVLQQENGRLACEPCGVHGCNKDGMIVHLYTRMHWEKANFTQKEKEQKAASAAEVLDEDDKCGSTAGDGSGGALTTTVV